MNAAALNIGIDLGTTNSALAWINPAEAEDTSFPPIHIFDIPQVVAPGRKEVQVTTSVVLITVMMNETIAGTIIVWNVW